MAPHNSNTPKRSISLVYRLLLSLALVWPTVGQPQQCTDVPEVSLGCRESFDALIDDRSYLAAREAFQEANGACYYSTCQKSGRDCATLCDSGLASFEDACDSVGGKICPGTWSVQRTLGATTVEDTYSVFDCFPSTCTARDVGHFAECAATRNCADAQICQVTYSCGALGSGAIVAIVVCLLITFGLGVGGYLCLKKRAADQRREAAHLVHDHTSSVL